MRGLSKITDQMQSILFDRLPYLLKSLETNCKPYMCVCQP